MGRSYNGGWEEDIATGVFGLALLGLIAVAAVVGTVLMVVLTELARVYQARALTVSRSRPILWIALAVLLALWLLCALLARTPATAPLGVYLSTWSFLAYVIVVEGCDLYEGRFDPPPASAPEPEVTVDQLLQPWHDAAVTSPLPLAPASNGHRQPASVSGG